VSTRTANCPNCGAEIVFRWSGAVQTNCPACRSVLVRHDIDLTRVGDIGDVPPSSSRIQLGTEGRLDKYAFVVVGRIIYKYGRGHWSEWHIRLNNDTSAWLSDAQGEYAVTREAQSPPHLDRVSELNPGERVGIAGTEYTIATKTVASYSGVEGELPFEYWDKGEVSFVDLRTADGGFGTVDYSESPPMLFVGKIVSFDDLKLKNLREGDGGVALAADAAKGLNCSQCGAAIEDRLGELAQTVACPACTAIMDATDANYRVLVQSQSKSRPHLAIPLGSVGKFKGESWQAIGFQVRSITVDEVEYAWREYLLWNMEKGARYLTEYDGHWNDITVVKGVPRQVVGGNQPIMDYLGTKFKHFQTATATTRFVLGEFPWEVRTGDRSDGDDFVAPPLMLSREATKDEVTWSIGTYTPPERIAEAFALKQPLPRPIGIFANQPNPRAEKNRGYGAAFVVLLALLFAAFVFRMATARSERVFTSAYRYTGAADTSAFVTPVFEIKGHTSNVQLRVETNLTNDWAFFNLALLPESGGVGYDVGREVSNYAGYDGGEAWHEGSPNDAITLPSVPAGRYYLRVEPEHEAIGRPFAYTISVRRDVPRVLPFVLAFIALLIPPLLAWFNTLIFEHARWQESDHAPVSSDDDE
jgi:hypothetical protein